MGGLSAQLQRHPPPPALRRSLTELRTSLRRPTQRLRPLPDFLIIGGQRCGTTSVFNYLLDHPLVLPPLVKEPQFFSYHWPRGTGWYRALFPTGLRRQAAGVVAGGGRAVTFEATPYYLSHPCAPERAAQVIPAAKLVVLVRDPVQRAYSHYQHSVRLGFESASFAAAIELEPTRLAGEEERIRSDSRYKGTNHRVFSYVSRGFYADQIERWLTCFPRESLHVIQSEALFADPGREHRELLTFLGLPDSIPADFRVHTMGSSSGADRIPVDVRRELEERYAPANTRLERLLGRELGWSA